MRVGDVPVVGWMWGKWGETPREVKVAVGALALVGLAFWVWKVRKVPLEMDEELTFFQEVQELTGGKKLWSKRCLNEDKITFAQKNWAHYVTVSDDVFCGGNIMTGCWKKNTQFVVIKDRSKNIACLYSYSHSTGWDKMRDWFICRECQLGKESKAKQCAQEDFDWFEAVCKA